VRNCGVYRCLELLDFLILDISEQTERVAALVYCTFDLRPTNQYRMNAVPFQQSPKYVSSLYFDMGVLDLSGWSNRD